MKQSLAEAAEKSEELNAQESVREEKSSKEALSKAEAREVEEEKGSKVAKMAVEAAFKGGGR